jgi:hypothetical protein
MEDREVTVKHPLEDEVYFTIEIRRSDVEARFAKTGTPAQESSMSLIGGWLRETPAEWRQEIKDCVMTVLLDVLTEGTKQELAEKQAERKKQCQVMDRS